MALTVPSEFQIPRPVIEEIHGSELVVHRDDLRSVRLYGRLAAAISALALVLTALVAYWLSIRLFGRHWDFGQTLIACSVVLIVAAVSYLRAELRLRSYRLELTSDAVVFEYGRTRSYIPREHVQLLDTETSILLRVFRLRRCCLHTGGGSVIVSPVPAHLVTAVERLIYEQPATMQPDRTDAGR